MKPEAQRIVIAEACGWQFLEQGVYVRTYPPRTSQKAIDALECPQDFWLVQTGSKNAKLDACKRNAPDYLNDLNAMHEVEKVLTELQRREYATQLSQLVLDVYHPSRENYSELAALISSTAAQRAEAFLRTLNLWKE